MSPVVIVHHCSLNPIEFGCMKLQSVGQVGPFFILFVGIVQQESNSEPDMSPEGEPCVMVDV